MVLVFGEEERQKGWLSFIHLCRVPWPFSPSWVWYEGCVAVQECDYLSPFQTGKWNSGSRGGQKSQDGPESMSWSGTHKAFFQLENDGCPGALPPGCRQTHADPQLPPGASPGPAVRGSYHPSPPLRLSERAWWVVFWHIKFQSAEKIPSVTGRWWALSEESNKEDRWTVKSSVILVKPITLT